MGTTVTADQYLEHLLKLAEAMLAAIGRDDPDMASELFAERTRYMEAHEPSSLAGSSALVERVLAADKAVIDAAQGLRGTMLKRVTNLRRIRAYKKD
jgi:hypothetical protein